MKISDLSLIFSFPDLGFKGFRLLSNYGGGGIEKYAILQGIKIIQAIRVINYLS